jgi:hypothetical protein
MSKTFTRSGGGPAVRLYCDRCGQPMADPVWLGGKPCTICARCATSGDDGGGRYARRFRHEQLNARYIADMAGSFDGYSEVYQRA